MQIGEVIRKYRKRKNMMQEELTQEEINHLVCKLDEKLQKESYDKVFQWAKKKIKQYPSCEMLMFQMILCLDAQREMQDIPDSESMMNPLTIFIRMF